MSEGAPPEYLAMAVAGVFGVELLGWDTRLVGSIAQPPSPTVSTEVAGKGGHSLDTAVREWGYGHGSSCVGRHSLDHRSS